LSVTPDNACKGKQPAAQEKAAKVGPNGAAANLIVRSQLKDFANLFWHEKSCQTHRRKK
jgi:hypothetical protein